MKVLVTGGAGYIGSVLVPLLLDKGYKVKVLDIGLFGLQGLDRVKDSIELEVGDIRRVTIDDVYGYDVIINLAALSNDPMANKWTKTNMSINRDGVATLVDVANKCSVPKFIQASTASIYDGLSDDKLLTEGKKVNPQYIYAKSKNEGERVLFSSKIRIPVALRMGTLFGFSPRMRFDLIVNTMVMKALTTRKITCFCGGKQWRPLLSVHDAAKAYLALIEADEDKISRQIFNVAYKNYQVFEIAFEIQKTLKEYADLDVNVVIDEDLEKDRNYKMDTSKIFDKIGFKASESISDAVKFMYNKIRDEKDLNNTVFNNFDWIENVLNVQSRIGKLNFSEIFI